MAKRAQCIDTEHTCYIKCIQIPRTLQQSVATHEQQETVELRGIILNVANWISWTPNYPYYWFKIGDFASTGAVDSKIQVEGVISQQPFLSEN